MGVGQRRDARCGEVTAMARSLPALMCWKVVTSELSMLSMTLPEIRSGTIWLEPL